MNMNYWKFIIQQHWCKKVCSVKVKTNVVIDTWIFSFLNFWLLYSNYTIAILVQLYILLQNLKILKAYKKISILKNIYFLGKIFLQYSAVQKVRITFFNMQSTFFYRLRGSSVIINSLILFWAVVFLSAEHSAPDRMAHTRGSPGEKR